MLGMLGMNIRCVKWGGGLGRIKSQNINMDMKEWSKYCFPQISTNFVFSIEKNRIFDFETQQNHISILRFCSKIFIFSYFRFFQNVRDLSNFEIFFLNLGFSDFQIWYKKCSIIFTFSDFFQTFQNYWYFHGNYCVMCFMLSRQLSRYVFHETWMWESRLLVCMWLKQSWRSIHRAQSKHV